MESYDALIVGGGPAGSSCAWRLRRHGLDVAVLDKASFPRDKVCAGWITPAVIQELQLDTALYARDHVLQPITSFRTGVIHGGEHETHYPSTVSYGIRRREFDDYLLKRSGARVLQGQALRTLEKRGDHWLVNGSIAAPLLIGAGGHFCPVARHLGAKLGSGEPVVAAQEIEFEMDQAQRYGCQVQTHMPELYFCRDFKGYGWCFRKGNHLNIGLGRTDNRHLAQHLEEFCTFLKRRGRIPHDLPDRFPGHAYLLYGRALRKLYDDGVLLAGDAAGLAYPQSGEGIRPAVESGLLAASVAIEAKGDYRSERLRPYQQNLQAHFGPPMTQDSLAPDFLRGLLGRALMGSGWFTRHVVLDRWFLHADQLALSV